MFIRLMLFGIGAVMFGAFLYFFLQVLYLGTIEFFRRRDGKNNADTDVVTKENEKAANVKRKGSRRNVI